MKATALLGELRAFPEFATLPVTGPLVAYLAPVGPPRPVLVLPGFINGDSATIALRAFLRSLGHRPHGWGLGLNVGAAHHLAEGLDQRLTELYQQYNEPIDLVGWSAGGIFARVLASHRPEMVRQVVSLGSPVRLEPEQSNLAGVSEFLGRFYLQTPSTIDVDDIPVPSTCVWTASDGIVPAAGCQQTTGLRAENVQVRGSHSGLGANPAAFFVVADRLAQSIDQWARFEPPARLERLFPKAEDPLCTN